MRDVIYLMIIQSISGTIIAAITSIINTIRYYITNYEVLWYKYKGYVFYEIVSDKHANNPISYHIQNYIKNIKPTGNLTIICESTLKYGDTKDGKMIFRNNPGWVMVDDVYVKYTRVQIDADKERGTSACVLHNYTICGIGNYPIEAFLARCEESYMTVKKYEQKKYLVLKSASDVYPTYDLYDFESACCFDNIFFPQKEVMLDLLEQLRTGEIRRLNILLSGKPGCGKSSIIKAIINLTNRNLIDVKLSKITTSVGLFSVFWGACLESSYNIQRKSCIYMMEEIDTMGKLVGKRTEIDEDKEDTQLNKINIGDLLTTFDGVLELNGIITIITTNYPEKLDPALIREGRIQLHCDMKFCTRADAIKIIKSRKRFVDYDETTCQIVDDAISPARLISYCEQSKNIDDLNANINSGKWIR